MSLPIIAALSWMLAVKEMFHAEDPRISRFAILYPVEMAAIRDATMTPDERSALAAGDEALRRAGDRLYSGPYSGALMPER